MVGFPSAQTRIHIFLLASLFFFSLRFLNGQETTCSSLKETWILLLLVEEGKLQSECVKNICLDTFEKRNWD